ncbi:MAG: DUF192 domain-containing protein [Alphaproteobacteria bacterium]|nr:DUF192 domain-containing protein [Alphaproteobacteria bacterium]
MSITSDLILVGEPLCLAAANSSNETKFRNMKINKKRFTVILICCAIVFLAGIKLVRNLETKEIAGFNRDPKNYNAKIQILNADSQDVAHFKIAIANNDERKMYGLMFLDHLPADQGMLFPFEPKQMVTMWMKNTHIPLDMIFVGEDDKISSIAANAKPYSLDLISSQKEVKFVLEINGGLSDQLGIKPGQKFQVLN